jgi:uncharacterized protein (UPF0333 family)
MRSKRAQIAMEFMIIMGAVLFFVTVFFSVVQDNTANKMYQRENTIVKEIAITIQNEIDLATRSIDGYSRNFKIPRKAGNLDYEVNVTSGAIYIKTLNGKHAMAFPVAVVTGNINITDNTIKKINGEVFLNP